MQTLNEKYNALLSNVKTSGVARRSVMMSDGNYIATMCINILGSQSLEAQKYRLFDYNPQTSTLEVNPEFARPLSRLGVVFDLDKYMEIAGKADDLDENYLNFNAQCRYFTFTKYADFHKNFTFRALNVTGHVTYNADQTETRFNGATIDINCGLAGNKNFQTVHQNSGIGEAYKDYDVQILTRYNYEDFIEKIKQKFGNGKLKLTNGNSCLIYRVNNTHLLPNTDADDNDDLNNLPVDYNKDFDVKMKRLIKSPDMKEINAIRLGSSLYK